MSERRDLFERNADLNRRIDEEPIDDLIRDLARSGRTNRRYIRVLAVSIAFDVVLTILLGSVGLVARSASERASSAETVAYQRCLAGNDFRSKDLAHWNEALRTFFIPAPGEKLSPQQQRQLATAQTLAHQLQAQIAHDDAALPCRKP